MKQIISCKTWLWNPPATSRGSFTNFNSPSFDDDNETVSDFNRDSDEWTDSKSYHFDRLKKFEGKGRDWSGSQANTTVTKVLRIN